MKNYNIVNKVIVGHQLFVTLVNGVYSTYCYCNFEVYDHDKKKNWFQ